MHRGKAHSGNLQFIELLLEMQNEECAVQNECIFFENDFNQSAKPTPLFYILHSAFCIAQPKLRDKLQFMGDLNGNLRKS